MMQINDIVGKLFSIGDVLEDTKETYVPFLGEKLENLLEPVKNIVPDNLMNKDFLDLDFKIDLEDIKDDIMDQKDSIMDRLTFDEMKDHVMDKLATMGDFDAATDTLADMGLDLENFAFANDFVQFKADAFEEIVPVLDIFEGKFTNLFNTEKLEDMAMTAQERVVDIVKAGKNQLKEQVDELASRLNELASEFQLDLNGFMALDSLDINIPFLKERIEKRECLVGDFLVDVIGFKTQVVSKLAEEYSNVAESMEELVLDIGSSLENILPTELIPNNAVVQRIRSLEIAKLSFVANKALDFLENFDESTSMAIASKFEVLDDVCDAFESVFETESCEQVINAMRLSVDEVHTMKIAKLSDKVTALDYLITEYINLLERQ